MKSQNIKILVNLILLSFILLAISLPIFAQEQSEKTNAPIVDYKIEIEKTVSKERQEKNNRITFRFTSGGEITELPIGVESLPLINHWWIRIPALPIDQSSTIILGEVTDAEAHLSGDKTGIYSEFLVNVGEVFKDNSKVVRLNSLLTINRFGGIVRFASGRVDKYSIHRQGMPQKGERYIFFLNQTESGDFFILTGYKLIDNRVIPLDGEDSKDSRSALPFAKYRGVKESTFLQDLQTNLGTIEVNK